MEHTEYVAYLSEIKSGENNGMYNKGHLLKGNKNGRAKKCVVKIKNYVFYCDGTIKYFNNAFKEYFKCNGPIRSRGFAEKYGCEIIEITDDYELPVDYIVFKDAQSFDAIKHETFEKYKAR